jgi:glycine/D-amino acid oxidase-like deaminating enzyme
MESIWNTGISYEKRPSLREYVSADAVVVGAGLTGILTAYLLAKQGIRVIVLEKASPPESMASYTTAFITVITDTLPTELAGMLGYPKMKSVLDAGSHAIDELENIVRAEQISCEFTRCAEYIVAYSSRELRALSREAAISRKAGYRWEVQEKNALSFDTAGSLLVPDQAKFHPLRFMLALQEKAEAAGAQFFDDSEVLSVSDSTPVRVQTKHAAVTAPYAILATYDPVPHAPELRMRKGAYVSYVLEAEIAKNSLPEALFLDMHNPYHYFRIDARETFDRLILGGADHRKEIPVPPEKNFRALEEYLKKHLPLLAYTLTQKWHGLILEPADGLPFIGPYKKGANSHMAATGFSGNGMTYALIAAEIFADTIKGKESSWQKIFDPRRQISLRALAHKGIDYTREFFGGAGKNLFR